MCYIVSKIRGVLTIDTDAPVQYFCKNNKWIYKVFPKKKGQIVPFCASMALQLVM